MAKKQKKHRRGGGAAQADVKPSAAKASAEAKPLDDRPRKREPKPVKLSAKERSAIAKKETRARWMKATA